MKDWGFYFVIFFCEAPGKRGNKKIFTIKGMLGVCFLETGCPSNIFFLGVRDSQLVAILN
jgi:hypothetical protein